MSGDRLGSSTRLRWARVSPSRGSGVARRRIPGRRGSILPPLLVVLALSGALAQAETPAGYEEILFQEIPSVLAASKYEQRASEAPAAVTVITAEEIARHGYRTLADVLRAVRGFYTTYDRNYTYVGVRGISRPGDFNTRILLLVDGHRVNDCVTDMAYVGTESLVELGVVRRIEVVRGASSSLYGTNAFLAVVNVVTRTGAELSGGEANVYAGSFGTYGGRIAYGARTDSGMNLLLSASGYRARGQDHYYSDFDDPATNGGRAVGIDDDQRRHGFAKLTFGNHAIELAVNNRTKQVPTASYETLFNDPREWTVDRTAYLSWRRDAPLGDDGRIVFSASYDQSHYHGRYPYGDGVMWDSSDGRWWTAEAQVLVPVRTGHRLTAGAEYRFNAQQAQAVGYEGETSPTFADRRRSHNEALYAQDEWRLSKRVILNAGVRHDRYESFGGTTNPRLALIVNPDEHSAVKMLYGSAFRAPNAYELHYHDAWVTQKPPVALNPETIRSYEITYERTGSTLSGSMSVFRYRIADLISLTTDPKDELLVFDNVDRVESTGIEIELGTRIGGRIDVRGSYAYQRAKDLSTGAILTNAPRHLAHLNVGTRLFEDLVRVGLELGHVGARLSARREVVAGQTTANVVLEARGGRDFPTVTLGVFNIFDRDVADPGGEEHFQPKIPQDGRAVRFSVTSRF